MGWQRHPGAKLSYISPWGKIINTDRDLAPGDQIYGDEYFPGKRKVSRVSQPSPTPACSTSHQLQQQQPPPVAHQ